MNVHVICQNDQNNENNRKQMKKQKYLEKRKPHQFQKSKTFQQTIQPEQQSQKSQQSQKPQQSQLSQKIEQKKQFKQDKIIQQKTQMKEDIVENKNDLKEILEFDEQKIQEDIFSQQQFKDLKGLNKQLVKALELANYRKMTKIQQVSIPIVQQGKNCAIKSQTGSGKTLAYLVPILQNFKVNDEESIQCLIICPTRELALQVYQTLDKIVPNYKELNFGLITGGEDLKQEKATIRKGLNILIATPGKLIYHLKNTQNLNYNDLQHIVFEESDRTLDLGFQKELEMIIQIMNEKKAIDQAQKILISATFNEKIENLCLQSCQSTMTFIGFNNSNSLQDDKINIPQNLNQKFCLLDEDQKFSFLIAYLFQFPKDKIIIFTHTIDQVEYFETILSKLVFRQHDKPTDNKVLNQQIFKLHGNIDQKIRQETYNEFKNRKEGAILISTDVASRGLDFYEVKHTILMDMPDSVTEYAHRIGRTARVNNIGTSLLILIQKCKFLDYLKDFKLQRVDKLQIYNQFTQQNIQQYREAKQADNYIISLVRELVSRENDLYFMARKAYNSYMRAYQYNKNKSFQLKALNLLGLAKGFGLNKVHTSKKETNNQLYQQDLQKRYDDKNEYTMQHPAKKHKLQDIKMLQNMEFM